MATKKRRAPLKGERTVERPTARKLERKTAKKAKTRTTATARFKTSDKAAAKKAAKKTGTKTAKKAGKKAGRSGAKAPSPKTAKKAKSARTPSKARSAARRTTASTKPAMIDTAAATMRRGGPREVAAPATTFQEMILRLQRFWADRGCILVQPSSVEVGAGTLNKHTFLRVLGPEPWNVAYVEPSRRPTDGRYGENPNRLQHYYQFQVVLKPSPDDVQEQYIASLRALGVDPVAFDVRFVEDDWEHPALGAAGLGWEVWAQGMEVTQFTYFQQCGGLDLPRVSCELTYGLERLAMYIQDKENVYDLAWAVLPSGQTVTYGDVHKQDEVEWSWFNFKHADVPSLLASFDKLEAEAKRLLAAEEPSPLVLPAYEHVLRCSHTFNVLQARGVVSQTERAAYIARIRDLARRCAETYLERRRALGFPMLTGPARALFVPSDASPGAPAVPGAPPDGTPTPVKEAAHA